mgnify:CR=1 FL=1
MSRLNKILEEVKSGVLIDSVERKKMTSPEKQRLANRLIEAEEAKAATLYLLEMEAEYSIHSTLKELAQHIYDFVDMDVEQPFESVRGLYTVHKKAVDKTTLYPVHAIEHSRVDSLVIDMITETQLDAAEWQQHIKMEGKNDY